MKTSLKTRFFFSITILVSIILMLALIPSSLLAATVGRLMINEQNCPINGNQITFTVSISNAPRRVTSMGFKIIFDESILEYVGYTRGNLTSGFTLFDVNRFQSNTLQIGGLDTGAGIAQGASGVVVELTFILHKCESTTLELSDLVDDLEGSGWQTTDGKLTPLAPSNPQGPQAGPAGQQQAGTGSSSYVPPSGYGPQAGYVYGWPTAGITPGYGPAINPTYGTTVNPTYGAPVSAGYGPTANLGYGTMITPGYSYPTASGYGFSTGYGSPSGYGFSAPTSYGFSTPISYGLGSVLSYGLASPLNYASFSPWLSGFTSSLGYGFSSPTGYGFPSAGYGLSGFGLGSSASFGLGSPFGYGITSPLTGSLPAMSSQTGLWSSYFPTAWSY